MGEHEVKVIRSTADLTPDGILGYAKALAGFISLLGAIAAATQPYLPEGSDWARWAGLAVAAAGAFGVWALKNNVQPERVIVPGPDPQPFLDAVKPPNEPPLA